MCCRPAALATACPYPHRLRRVDPQGWSQCGVGGLMDQVIAGGLLKSGIVDFLPHPQVFDGSVAPHPALYKITGDGGLFLLCDFRHGDIWVHIDLLGPHLLPQRRGEKARDLLRIQLFKQLFREFICLCLGDESFFHRPPQNLFCRYLISPQRLDLRLPVCHGKHPSPCKSADRDIIPDSLLQE